MLGLGRILDQTACSRAECRAAGSWRLDWRNPRIHSTDRVKTWLACDEHVDYLREFLAARDFPLTVSALGAASSVDTPVPDLPLTDAPRTNAGQSGAEQ